VENSDDSPPHPQELRTAIRRQRGGATATGGAAGGAVGGRGMVTVVESKRF